jgi:uncharacterized protein (TIGR00730 family)
MSLRTVCVYCGSSKGDKEEYSRAAKRLGEELVDRNIQLVYGGGSMGLMGDVASAVQQRGGRVVGIIPKHLEPSEISGKTYGEVLVTENMHERKMHMANLADAFVALPGGFGTLEELLEIITWRQLNLHSKRIGVLNTEGYFDSLLHFFDQAVSAGFINSEARDMLIQAETPELLIEKLLLVN